MRATVYIPDDELQKFLKDLQKADSATRKKAGDIMLETAVNIDKNAKEYVPVKTGRLRSSIRHSQLTQDNLNHVIKTDVSYAAFVEKGTSKQRPQPYLRPAFLIGVNRFYAKMRNLIPN